MPTKLVKLRQLIPIEHIRPAMIHLLLPIKLIKFFVRDFYHPKTNIIMCQVLAVFPLFGLLFLYHIVVNLDVFLQQLIITSLPARTFIIIFVKAGCLFGIIIFLRYYRVDVFAFAGRGRTRQAEAGMELLVAHPSRHCFGGGGVVALITLLARAHRLAHCGLFVTQFLDILDKLFWL